MKKSRNPPGKVIPLGPETRFAIGRHLRVYYDGLLHQELPDRLADILKQIDQPSGPSAAPEKQSSEQTEGSQAQQPSGVAAGKRGDG